MLQNQESISINASLIDQCGTRGFHHIGFLINSALLGIFGFIGCVLNQNRNYDIILMMPLSGRPLYQVLSFYGFEMFPYITTNLCICTYLHILVVCIEAYRSLGTHRDKNEVILYSWMWSPWMWSQTLHQSYLSLEVC